MVLYYNHQCYKNVEILRIQKICSCPFVGFYWPICFRYQIISLKFFSSFIEKEEEKKDGIERQLEDSDKALSQLILLGDELVTNIKIANEKREVMRRNYEALKREGIGVFWDFSC